MSLRWSDEFDAILQALSAEAPEELLALAIPSAWKVDVGYGAIEIERGLFLARLDAALAYFEITWDGKEVKLRGPTAATH